MSDFREEEKLGKLYDTQITRRLMKYLWPYRWLVVRTALDDVPVAEDNYLIGILDRRNAVRN